MSSAELAGKGCLLSREGRVERCSFQDGDSMQVHTYELQRYCRAADRIDTVSCQSQHRCGALTGRTVSVSSGSSGREPLKPTLNITAHIWSKELSNTQLSRHYSHTTRRTGESNRTKNAIFAGWLRQRDVDVDYSAAHSVRYHITLAWHGMAGTLGPVFSRKQ